ncbi:MAG: polysaccharide deacetylase family protein [Bacteroidales bacterium]|nr:polysaccharide deacetylase family protein [Bacteroidales bacterium]
MEGVSFGKKIGKKLFKLTHPAIGDVLMFHRVTDSCPRMEHNRRFCVSSRRFEGILQSYLNRGYVFISLDQLANLLHERERLHHRFVCVTFDDGYRDNYDVAYPILKRYNVPFTIYVASDFIERRAVLWWYILDDIIKTNEEYLVWHDRLIDLPLEQIRHIMQEELSCAEGIFYDKVDALALNQSQLLDLAAEPLCTIGAHTISHCNLSQLSVSEQYAEIKGSLDFLKEITHQPVVHFSYPFGSYNSDTLSVVKELHLETVTKAWGGAVRKGESMYEISRIEIQ